MAKSHYYTPRKIVLTSDVRHRVLDDWTDTYVGEAEALERAGLITREMLPPAGSGSITWRPIGECRKGVSAHYEPGYMKIIRLPTSGYSVWLTVSREEQQARCAASAAKAAERRNAWEAAHTAKRVPTQADKAEYQIACLPKSHEEFREQSVKEIASFARMALKVVQEDIHGSGYRLSRETSEEFLLAIEEALDVIRNGSTIFDKERRKARELELRARMASGDGEFKPFMSRVLRPLCDTLLKESNEEQ